MIEDVAGRINSANVTPEEWQLLEYAHQAQGWFTPTPEQWSVVRGLLALVDIRRGFEVMNGGGIQLGVAQVHLNRHGRLALSARERGDVYTYGKPLSDRAIKRLVEK